MERNLLLSNSGGRLFLLYMKLAAKYKLGPYYIVLAEDDNFIYSSREAVLTKNEAMLVNEEEFAGIVEENKEKKILLGVDPDGRAYVIFSLDKALKEGHVNCFYFIDTPPDFPSFDSV